MSTPLGALLESTPVRSGESLASLLERLSQLNFYAPSNFLVELALTEAHNPRLYKDNLDFPSRIDTYENLVSLTRLDVGTLYNATPHRFAQILTSPPNTLESLKLPGGNFVPLASRSYFHRQIRPLFAGQFCPSCLQESAYHRLVWMPVAVSVCLQHKCLLMNHCISCNEELSVSDIVKTQCNKCHADLTEFKSFSVLGDELGLFSQSIIQSWFLHYASPDPVASLLPEQPPVIQYRIIEGLQTAAKMWRGGVEWPYLHRLTTEQHDFLPRDSRATQSLTPYKSYRLYTTAFRGIINWPEGFYEFLDAYRYYRYKDISKYGLGCLYTQWLRKYWLYPEFDFVQEAFEEYLGDKYCPSRSAMRLFAHQYDIELTSRFACVNISEAAILLETSSDMVELLLRNRLLSLYVSSNENGDKLLRSEVLDLRHRWNKVITLEETAILLGVTEQMVIGLVKIGLLSTEQSPAEGFLQWAFKRSRVMECLENMSKHVEVCSTNVTNERNLYLSLAEASRLPNVIGMNAISMLLSVAEGRLRAYHPANQSLQLKSLLFATSDIQACREARKEENCWIGSEEVTILFGVKDGILARWVKVGLICPVAVREDIQYFDQSTINRFIMNYISLEEVAKMIGEEKLTLQRWARANLFSDICVSGPSIDGNHTYLFNKERLISWRNERVTFAEAVQLLGGNEAAIHRWYGEGKITPLKNMSNNKQSWFLKQQLLDLKGEETALFNT